MKEEKYHMIPDLVSSLFQSNKFKLDLIQQNTFKPSNYISSPMV